MAAAYQALANRPPSSSDSGISAASCSDLRPAPPSCEPSPTTLAYSHSQPGYDFLLSDLLVVPAHRDTTGGGIDVDSQLFGVGPTLDLVERTRALVPTVGAGIGMAHVSVTGASVAPFTSASASTWTAVPYVQASLAWSMAAGLRVRADVTSGWALDAVRVREADANVGRWGAPLVTAAAAIEILWLP